MQKYWVYMLRCADDSYYVGVTVSVTERVWQHNTGWDLGCYTHGRRPVELVYSTYFTQVHQALEWEKKIKRWGRLKKEALIADEWERLPRLAKKRFAKKNLSSWVPKPLCTLRYIAHFVRNTQDAH